MINLVISFAIGALFGSIVTLLASRPWAHAIHWQIGRISYTRSGQISSLGVFGYRRMRAGAIVKWVKAA